eukprot:jgi/Tetstr1/466115/TSEL_000943.t1
MELPPKQLQEPQVFALTCDAYRHLAALSKHAATPYEYRFVACLAAYAFCANTVWDSAVAALQMASASPSSAATLAIKLECRRTHGAIEEASRVPVSYIRHTKGGGKTSETDRVFVILAYDRFLKPKASSDYDTLH